jgi:hypothetical protein
MHETVADLRRLQAALDESYAHAGEHLRSIFTPDRRMSAEDLIEALRGVFLLHLATVTAVSAPMVAPIDGLFYRGQVWFGLPAGAVRIRHLRARPQVSATHTRGEDVCVIVHEVAHEIDPQDPQNSGFLSYCRGAYGPAWDYWRERYRQRSGSQFMAWIEPRRLYATRGQSDPVAR